MLPAPRYATPLSAVFFSDKISRLLNGIAAIDILTKNAILEEGFPLRGYLSALALLLFFGLVIGRTLSLRKRGIRAIVFGETHKSDFLLLPIFPVFAYTVLAGAFGLPLPRALKAPFWVSGAVAWIGLLLCAAALVVFAATLKAFGDSFRVGIDDRQPDKLVTAGPFALSRNPIYVCFLAFFFGMFLQYPNLILAGLIALFAPLIHRQILREETFLLSHYGEEYAAYCARVRRYL